MTDILILLWVALVLYILYTVVKKLRIHTTSYLFQDWEKADMPYITLDIQGEQFNMITDSAAAVSVLRREALGKLKSYEDSSRSISLTALTNDGIRNDVITVPVTINNKEIKTDFIVYDGGDIADFSRKHGVEIHGILGVEFFKKTKGIVDFSKQMVIFPQV